MACMSRNLKNALAIFLLVSIFHPFTKIKAQEPGNPIQPPANFERDEDDASILRKREDWFYRQRAFPHEKIPAGARLNAVRQLDEQMAVERAHPELRPMAATAPEWKFIGPKPIDTPYTDPVVSGRVAAIAIDPTNPSVIYAGAAQGGVWKTTNAGATWTELTDTEPSLAVGSIAIDPLNHETIYVGTGEENFSGDSYYGAGILKSTNGGASWTHICGPFCGPLYSNSYWYGGARIGSIAIQPGNSKVLLAAVEWYSASYESEGIYRSADAGETWAPVLAGNFGTAVLFDPKNGSIAYAALGSSSGGTEGVYKSVNGGLSWSAVNGSGATALNLTGAGRIVLAIAPSATNTVYVSVEEISTSGVLGMWKTIDGGSKWNQLTAAPNYCTPQCWYDNVMAVQPNNPDVIYAGGAYSTTLARSVDGGAAWVTLQAGEFGGVVHADIHALTFTHDSSKLYVGSDGGVYSTVEPVANTPVFAGLNQTLGITQFYPGLALGPGSTTLALGGTQDNGTLLYSGKPEWNQVTCGDGGYSAIDPANTKIMYTACNGVDVEKSAGSGSPSSWVYASAGIELTARVQFIPPLVIDPSNASRLYFGTYLVYQTTDQAAAWTAISGDVTAGSVSEDSIVSIAVAPTNPNTIYTGSSQGLVYVTTDALKGTGSSWKNVSAGLPPRSITQIAVHPTAPETAYVTFSGFSGYGGDTLGHVFKTTDGGAKWTDISGNLLNIPVNSIAIDRDLPGYIFIGTDLGTYYTANGGKTWSTLMEGLPRVAVLGLSLNNATYTLNAATHGRGVWSLNITSVVPVVTLTSISPASATAGSKAIDLTVKGTNFSKTSLVRWNGVDLTTKYVSATELTATIPAKDLTKVEDVPLTVYRPGTPNLVSHAIDFDVKKKAASPADEAAAAPNPR